MKGVCVRVRVRARACVRGGGGNRLSKIKLNIFRKTSKLCFGEHSSQYI